jgi:calcium-dependent protein kinase
MDLNGDGKLSK